MRWDDGDEETFILRGDPPAGSGVFVSDRDTEADLVRTLAAKTSVRTPVLRWYDATGEYLGSKCMVMEAVTDATDLQTVMAQADSVEPLTDLFVDTFAAVHATPLAALPPTLPRASSWDSYLDGVSTVTTGWPMAPPARRRCCGTSAGGRAAIVRLRFHSHSPTAIASRPMC